MSYSLQPGEQFKEGLDRIVTEEIDKALKALRNEENPHEGIHEARKKMKKVRAAWRLTRFITGEDGYKERNVFFRDQARRISDLRDATARIETVEWLSAQAEDEAGKKALDDLSAWLKEHRLKEVEKHHPLKELLLDIADELENSKNWIFDWEPGSNFKSLMQSGLHKVYRRGFQRFRDSLEEQNDETIHQWRKRAKYLRYILRILRHSWKPILKPWYDQLHDLTDQQGYHHDLTVLEKFIAREEPALAGAYLNRLNEQVKRERYLECLRLGRRLYAEKPNPFSKRILAYYAAWEDKEEAT